MIYLKLKKNIWLTAKKPVSKQLNSFEHEILSWDLGKHIVCI